MTVSSELSNLRRLRKRAKYQAAERTRRRIKAAGMAKKPPTSKAYRQLLLMVDVWERIATRVRKKKSLTKPYFETSPVGYMWNNLSPGIKIIQKKSPKDRGQKFSAKQFGMLNTAYRSWLKRQTPKFRSAAKSGMGAQFG